METNDIVTISGNAGTYILAALQQNEILQYIEFGLSALVSLIIIAFKIWKWWKEAKKDGKITQDELSDLQEIVKKGEDDEQD